MPTPTYTALAAITITSSSSGVAFSNIPATYRDLLLIISGTASIATGITIRHNGDTNNANYNSVNMAGDGSTRYSGTAANSNMISLYTQQSMGIIQMVDYSATDKHKIALARSDSAPNELYALARRWANTAAINSISVGLTGGSFNSGTTLNLYGVIS